MVSRERYCEDLEPSVPDVSGEKDAEGEEDCDFEWDFGSDFEWDADQMEL